MGRFCCIIVAITTINSSLLQLNTIILIEVMQQKQNIHLCNY